MKRGFITSWETKLEKTPHLGDKLSLPTLTGMATFTVTELEGDMGVVECGDCVGRIKKNEDDEWIHPHGLIDKHVLAMGVIVSNDAPLPSSMNPNIGTSKVYK